MNNLLGGMSFTFGSIIVVLLLQTVYSFQNKINDTTSKLYKILIYCIEFMMIAEIICSVIIYKNFNITLSNISIRIHWISVLIFFYFLFIYSLAIEKDYKDISVTDLLFKNKKLIIFNIAFCLLVVATMFVLPMPKIDPNHINYLKLNISYTVAILLVITTSSQITIHFRAKNKSKVKNHFLLLKMTFEAIPITVHIIFPYISFAPIVVTYLLIMIYLLIENPDLQVLNELEREKKLIDDNNNFKFSFLSKEASNLKPSVDNLYSYVNFDGDINNIKSNSKLIISQSKDILNSMQSTLDIVIASNGSNVVEYENYDLNSILSKLYNESLIKLEGKNISLNFNIDKMAPSVLYGDKNKVYQILKCALNEAIDNTRVGKINFNLNCSFINDGVNLSFNISDSSTGIAKETYDDLINKLNNLDNIDIISNTNLNYVIMKKFITYLDGSMNISSTLGAGTVVTFAFNQKIINESYIGPLYNNIQYYDLSSKKALIISNNPSGIIYNLKKHHMMYDTVNNVNECINKFKAEEKYNILFLDPQLDNKELYPARTIKSICKEINVNVPPIVALSMNSIIGSKNKYLSESFDYYLLQPIDELELKNILSIIKNS